MLEGAPAIFVALEGSALGHAIRQSSWAYMTANVGHILSLAVFAGAVAVMDGRMAGAFAATAPGQLLRRTRLIAILAFLGLLLSGSVLFTAEASHVIMNRVFQVKLGLIALALINVAAFEIVVAPKVRDLPPLATLPAAAKRAGISTPTGTPWPFLPQVPTPLSSAMSSPTAVIRCSASGPLPINIAPFTGAASLPPSIRKASVAWNTNRPEVMSTWPPPKLTA